MVRSLAGVPLGQIASASTNVAEELGSSMVNGIRAGANAVADTMPPGSPGRTGMQGLRYEMGAVGDVGNARLLARVEAVLDDAPIAQAALRNTAAIEAQAARRAILADQFDRPVNLDEGINLRGAQATAGNFFRKQGVAETKIPSHQLSRYACLLQF